MPTVRRGAGAEREPRASALGGLPPPPAAIIGSDADLRVPLPKRPPVRGLPGDVGRPVAACQECGAPVERVFHPVAVHFKGSGFYTTDYARKAGAKASADGGSDSQASTDSKDSKDSKKDKKKPAASSSKKDD